MAKKSKTKKGKAALTGTLKSTITGGVTNAGSFGKLKTTTPQTPAAQQAAAAATNNATANNTATTNPNFIKAQTDLPEMKYREGWNPYNLTEIKPYQESQAVQDARTRLNTYLDGEGKPAYSSQYADTIKNLADKIANREDFSYDFNTDPLYQNYRDQYQRQAVLGQQGAMANAAALTGGYGSSYASTAGNLAYQENMSQLNNVIPQLYQMAYDKYNTDLSNQRADLSMYQDLENTDYGRYRDSMSDWNTDRGYYTDYYNNEYNKDYGQYRDNVADVQHNDQMRYQSYVDGRNYTSGEHWNKTNLAYQKAQDELAQKNWEKEFKENKRQFDKQLKLAKKAKASGGSGGGGGRSYGSGSSSSGIPTAVYNTLRKYKNGNKPQGEIAANVLNKLASQYNLNSSQTDYLYHKWLGYKSAPTVKENTKHDTAKDTKYQTYFDVPKAARNKYNIMTDDQFTSYKAQNKGGGKWKNYEAYLKAMAKKYGF
jgi:hypothetical protein